MTKTKKPESRQSVKGAKIRQQSNVHPFPAVEGGDMTPPEPDWGCRYQHQADRDLAAGTWAEVVSDLRSRQALSPANGDSICRLIDMRVAYRDVQKELDERGVMLTTKETLTRYANPALHLLRGIDESIRQLESELCIAPLRRARAGKVQRKARAARPADAYLRPVGA
jgi:phage terminase small subunit